MNLIKNFSFFLVLTLFSQACTEKVTPLQRLLAQENNLRTRGGYESYLALEYLSFSRNLLSVKDEEASNYFAIKGLSFASGKILPPENPIKWQADPSQIEEMVLMQKRLEITLESPGIKTQLPIQAAHLTYLYDCWISRESKAVFRADELAQCRVRFTKLLDEIEHYIDDLKRDRQPKVEIIEPKFERFEILFDFNNAKFNDKANKDLIALLKYLKTLNGDFRILVVGNADRTGSELYNQSLALDRAEVTKNYLIKNGVNEKLVELRSVGEDFPDIITKDGTQQQSNRTVGIYVLKGGFSSFETFPLPLIENFVYRQEIKKTREERGLGN